MARHIDLPRTGALRRIAPAITPSAPMPHRRHRGSAIRHAIWALGAWTLLALLHPGTAGAEHESSADAPHPTVFASLPFAATLTLPAQPADAARMGVVVIAHDRLGSDTRAEPYAVQLLGAGIAVLDVLQPDAEAAELDLAAAALATDNRFDPRRIGLLAFGAGGIAAARTQAPFRAQALFYPGCATVAALLPGVIRRRADTEILLAHGSEDGANPAPACEATANLMRAQGAGVRRVEYAAAGYAWDRPAFGLEGRSLLPRPDGQGRVVSVPRPDLTGLSATTVASFFARALRPAAQ